MNDKLTEIIFLLDRSGSMSGLENDTIGGFNAFVKKQTQLEGDVIVTTVLFDDKYDMLWSGIEADKAKLTEDEYYVRGMTALLDAIGKTILDVGNRLSNTPEDRRPGKIIFVITTDGLENASIEFTYEKISELIKRQQEKYNWEFIFLAANIDATKEAGNIGIHESDAYSFEATEAGVEDMYFRAAEMVSDRRGKNKKK